MTLNCDVLIFFVHLLSVPIKRTMKKLLKFVLSLSIFFLVHSACTPEPDYYYYAIIEDDSGSRETQKKLGRDFYDQLAEQLLSHEQEVTVEYYKATNSDPLPIRLKLPALPLQVTRVHPEYNQRKEELEQVIEERKVRMNVFFDSIQALPIVPAKGSHTYLERIIARLPLKDDASKVAILFSTDLKNHPEGQEHEAYINDKAVSRLNAARQNGAIIACYTEAEWSLIQDTLQLDITLLRHPEDFFDLFHPKLSLQNQ